MSGLFTNRSLIAIVFSLLGFAQAACQNPQAPEGMSESVAENSQDIRITGFFKSAKSQSIRPPAGGGWSFKITYLADEGTRVAKGDLVAKFEGQRLKEEMNEVKNDLLEAENKAEQRISAILTEIDTLKVGIQDDRKQLSLLKAGTTPGNASTQWLVPKRVQLIEKLDIQAREMEIELKRDKLKRKEELLTLAKLTSSQSIASRKESIKRIEQHIEDSSLFADHDGVIVYKRVGWKRQKPQKGGLIYRGDDALSVVDDHNLYLEAYLPELFRKNITNEAEVQIKLLGQKETTVSGSIMEISKIVLPVRDWDKSLPDNHAILDIRTFKLKINIPSMPAEARPNGEVEISLRNHQQPNPQAQGA